MVNYPSINLKILIWILKKIKNLNKELIKNHEYSVWHGLIEDLNDLFFNQIRKSK